MNFTLHLLSQPGERIQFHAFAIAFILTGVFMVLTASDLGAMGPLVISLGLYAMFFGVVAELLLGVRLLIARIAIRLFVKRLAHEIDTVGGV
jgi:hypothetical protein